MTINEKLTEEFEKRNITRAEFARIIGVDPTVVTGILKGRKVGNITIKKIVGKLGSEYEKFYEYKYCEVCGKKFLPQNCRVKTCSDEYSKTNVNELCINWVKSHRERTVSSQTEAQRYGWGAKVKAPSVSFAELENKARSQGVSYGQLGTTERLAQSMTMRESMGLG